MRAKLTASRMTLVTDMRPGRGGGVSVECRGRAVLDQGEGLPFMLDITLGDALMLGQALVVQGGAGLELAASVSVSPEFHAAIMTGILLNRGTSDESVIERETAEPLLAGEPNRAEITAIKLLSTIAVA